MNRRLVIRNLCVFALCLLGVVLAIVALPANTQAEEAPALEGTNTLSGWHISTALDNDALDGVTVRIRPAGSTSALAVNKDGQGVQNAVHLWEIGNSARLYLQKAEDGDDGTEYQIRFYTEFYDADPNLQKFEPDVDYNIGPDNWSVEGATVHVVDVSTDNHGYWEIVQRENGLYRIMAVISGKFLRLNDENKNGVWDNGDHLVQTDEENAMDFEMEIINPGKKDLNTVKQYSSYTFSLDEDTTVTAANWMSAIPDDTPMSDLNIPAAHDAGTCALMDISSWDPFNHKFIMGVIESAQMAAAECQQLFFDDLLRCGVRCFDLRCNHEAADGTSILDSDEKSPLLNHTVYCTDRDGSPLSMNDVWNYTKAFLATSPKEAVIWRISEQELIDTVNTNKVYDYFEELVNENPSMFYIGDHVPTMKEARGKILIFSGLSRDDLATHDDGTNRDYSYDKDDLSGKWALDITSTVGKIDYTTAGDTVMVTSGDNFEVWIEDDFKTNAETKWSRSTLPSLDKAYTHRNDAIGKGKYAWNIIYTSASAMKDDTTTPINAAKYTDHRVKSYFDPSLSNTFDTSANNGKYAGIVFMDFVDEQQCQFVYRQNFIMQMPKVPSSTDGAGTVDDPYIIHNENDWLTFASTVNSGNTSFCARLANNIENVTAMVGTSDHPYAGTFDGGGHEIRVYIESEEVGAAPFHYIEGAIISNVTVGGKVTGGNFCSGLVGNCKGTESNVIEDCDVYAIVSTSDTHCGGILGNSGTSNTTMRRCIFTGTLKNDGDCGMLWGWAEGKAKITLTDCFVRGSYDGSGSMSPVGLINITPELTVSDVFYATGKVGEPAQDGTHFGDMVYRIYSADSIHRKVTGIDGEDYYIIAFLEGLQSTYTYTGEVIDLGYRVREPDGFDGKPITRDVEYAASITDADGNAVTDADGNVIDDRNLIEPGTYNLVITGNADADFEGTITQTFTITSPEVLEGTWKRLGGAGRYETMQAVVSQAFPDVCETAVLVTGQNFPDALAASSLAGALSCPVVLTNGSNEKGELSAPAKAELERLGVHTVYVVGGAATVTDAIMDTVSGLNGGVEVKRVSGESRQGTSLAVLDEIRQLHDGSFDGTVVVATGKKMYAKSDTKKKNETGFADALSIGPWCYANSVPILLTGSDGKLTEDQLAALEELGGVKRLIIVGGEAAVDAEAVGTQLGFGSDEEYEVLAGADRYETSSIIAQWELAHGLTLTNAAVATGANFPDALAGTALCGSKDSVLILATKDHIGEDGNKDAHGLGLIADNAGDVELGFVLGGSNSVSDTLLDHLNSMA